MGKRRLLRTLEYSAKVMRLSPTSRMSVDMVLPIDRQWGQGRNVIYIIGDWLDPTSGPRGRLWWLLAFVVYGLWGSQLVGAGMWQFDKLLQGVAWLLATFVSALVIGVMLEIKRWPGRRRLV